jgi:myosin-crossreactive antigen
MLGSSIGSLASAVFLIRDAEKLAPHIHLFESRRAPEDGLPTTGDAFSGSIVPQLDSRTYCHFNYICTACSFHVPTTFGASNVYQHSINDFQICTHI